MAEPWAVLEPRGSGDPQPPRPARPSNATANRVAEEDRAVHRWYRFVIAYPPHLVRDYLQKFQAGPDDLVLDPFCGTGTTVVECKKEGVPSLGVESHPFSHFVADVKTDWTPRPAGLLAHAHAIHDAVLSTLEDDDVPDTRLAVPTPREVKKLSRLETLPEEADSLLISSSISPRPLHKVLRLRDEIRAHASPHYTRHELLALSKVLVEQASNLSFGPEVGLGAIKKDAAVVGPWLDEVKAVAQDLKLMQARRTAPAQVLRGDSREVAKTLGKRKVSIVITSPPYPNEKDYTRTTRLETVVLEFVKNKAELQAVKKGLVRSNTRGIYRADTDDDLVASNKEIQELADRIESRRIELGKTSGFERMFPRLTKLYFGGMQRHLEDLRSCLAPGAHLAYVVGDQASYLRVMIRTGDLLGKIAEQLGYEVLGLDLFRTRYATVTREQLREEVLVLRWPGSS